MAIVEIKMNDQTIRNVEVEDYDAQKLAEELNNSQNNYVAIGTGTSAVVLQRYSIVRITPVDLEDGSTDEEDNL